MTRKNVVLVGLLAAGCMGLGYAFSQYVSASKQAVQAVLDLQKKQNKTNEEIRREEENYTHCQRQQEECLGKISQHPRADGKAYRRVDDFLESVRMGYGTTWETAHGTYGHLSSREQKTFSEIIGIADVLLQCNQELSDCVGEIRQNVQAINRKLYDEQGKLSSEALCPQVGAMTALAVNLNEIPVDDYYCR